MHNSKQKGALPMFKIIALVLITILFLFNLFLNVRRHLARKREIPEEVKDVFDEEKYVKWRAYSADKNLADLIISTISFVVTFVLILTDFHAIVAKDIENPYLSAMAVLGIDLGITAILHFFIAGYVTKIKIEGKYGFNKSTIGTFISDCIKKILLAAVLMIGLTCLFIAIYEAIGDYILIIFSAILLIIIILVNFLFPIFSKAANRFAPLEEGELRTKLTDLLTKHGYRVRDIKVMDASRRTSKSNAYFAGFGRTKTIVLYDNMLKVLNEEEILAVFAHEMAHGIHKDSLKKFIFTTVSIVLLVLFAWLLVKNPQIFNDFGFNRLNYGFAVILLAECVIGVIFTLIGILNLMMSRHAEYKADELAAKEGYGEQLISGLKKLYNSDLGDINPDPVVVALTYSHPTLYQRIKNIEKNTKKPS